jgi:hypothetical protein
MAHLESRYHREETVTLMLEGANASEDEVIAAALLSTRRLRAQGVGPLSGTLRYVRSWPKAAARFMRPGSRVEQPT